MTRYMFLVVLAWMLPAAAEAGEGSSAEKIDLDTSSEKPKKNRFDAGSLFIGAQAMGNFTVNSLNSAKGQLGAGGSLLVEYVIIPYLKIGLEPGYSWAGYRNTRVTDSGANIVDDSLNLYVDPEDKIMKRGGRGAVRNHAFTLALVLKGRYPIAVGSKGMFLAPFISVGGQPNFNLSTTYAVANDDTFDYGDGLNKVDFNVLGGLGLDFSLGKAGQIGLEGRYLFGVIQTPEQEFVLNSRPNEATESEFPIDFTVRENRWSHVQLLLSYRYGFNLLGG